MSSINDLDRYIVAQTSIRANQLNMLLSLIVTHVSVCEPMLFVAGINAWL